MFQYIDLFAGIGGFHQAMNDFDAKCVFSSEWDQEAARIYFENYGLQPAGDITKIKEAAIPAHDVLCAGFPCQAFSISGKQEGFEDRRGTLFFDVARIARHHQPKVLLLENVRHLEKHDGGSTLKTIVDTLEALNYEVHFKVLNASHYGLPQNRKRIFIVGFRNDLSVGGFQFPSPSHESVCLMDILEENPENAKIIDRSDTVFTREVEPRANDAVNRPIQIGYINKGGQGERIYSPYGHAITLSAYGGGAGAKTGIYYINGKLRKLSPRECARVQGFPDTFNIHPSLTQSYKQFGNSVPVKILKAIMRQIHKTGCLGSMKGMHDTPLPLNPPAVPLQTCFNELV